MDGSLNDSGFHDYSGLIESSTEMTRKKWDTSNIAEIANYLSQLPIIESMYEE